MFYVHVVFPWLICRFPDGWIPCLGSVVLLELNCESSSFPIFFSFVFVMRGIILNHESIQDGI